MSVNMQGDSHEDTKPPANLLSSISSLVAEHYNIVATKVTQLNSYDDCNFRIESSSGERFVLKVTNSYDSSLSGLIEGQNDILLHLNNKGVVVPRVILNVHGNHLDRLGLGTDKRYAVRLLTYLPGQLLVNVPQIGQGLLIDCGRWLGKLTQALQDFSSSRVTTRADWPWTLVALPRILNHLGTLPSEEHRRVVSKVVKLFSTNILDKLEQLEYAYIHGDLNEQNILVDDGGQRVTGVIDFGDIQYAPRVFDLAIHLAYVMITLDGREQSAEASIDPILEAPRLVLRGYEQVMGRLEEKEMMMLGVCIMARMAQSVTLGYYTHSRYPDNDYLLTTARPGWKVLARLCDIDCNLLGKTWRATH